MLEEQKQIQHTELNYDFIKHAYVTTTSYK